MTTNSSIGNDAFFSLFRAVLEAAPDPTLVVDQNGKIVFANAATSKALGWEPTELVGLKVEVLVPARSREAHVRQREEYYAKPTMRAMGTGLELVAIHHRDGREIPVEISLNPLPAGTGARIVCVIRDISERKRIERELRELNAGLERLVAERTAQLESTNRELEMLAHSIAHDLRAPLRAIHSAALRFQEELGSKLDAGAQRYLEISASRSAQISSMLDDYLHLLDIGRRTINFEKVDMRALALQALDDAGLQLSKHVVLEGLPAVIADRGLMLEVWERLIDNAVKFSAQRNPPKIRISAAEDQDFFYFTVQDNGVGFDSAYGGKLFQVFERLHSAKDYPGNGVGLCLVRRILDRHGGGVSITGHLDRGVQAMFWLPKANS
jgi:PAS domain S-box-containing protein